MNSLGITRVGIRLTTAGLADLVGYELAADTGGAEMEQEFRSMMEFLAAYATAEGRKFAPEETLLHGYWTLKFRVSPQDRALLDLWEYDAATTGWIPGVRYGGGVLGDATPEVPRIECWVSCTTTRSTSSHLRWRSRRRSLDCSTISIAATHVRLVDDHGSLRR